MKSDVLFGVGSVVTIAAKMTTVLASASNAKEILNRMKVITDNCLLLWTDARTTVSYTNLNELAFILDTIFVPISRTDYEWAVLSMADGIKKVVTKEMWMYIKARRTSTEEDHVSWRSLSAEFRQLVEQFTEISNQSVLRYINSDGNVYTLLEWDTPVNDQ